MPADVLADRGKLTLMIVIAGMSLAAGSGCGEPAAVALTTEQEEAQQESMDFVGVDFGTYRMKLSRPMENIKVKLGFHLFATVDLESSEQVEKSLAACQHRLRNRVLVAVRTAGTDEFEDPDLKILRARILYRVAPLFRRSLVHDLHMADFTCAIE